MLLHAQPLRINVSQLNIYLYKLVLLNMSSLPTTDNSDASAPAALHMSPPTLGEPSIARRQEWGVHDSVVSEQTEALPATRQNTPEDGINEAFHRCLMSAVSQAALLSPKFSEWLWDTVRGRYGSTVAEQEAMALPVLHLISSEDAAEDNVVGEVYENMLLDFSGAFHQCLMRSVSEASLSSPEFTEWLWDFVRRPYRRATVRQEPSTTMTYETPQRMETLEVTDVPVVRLSRTLPSPFHQDIDTPCIRSLLLEFDQQANDDQDFINSFQM